MLTQCRGGIVGEHRDQRFPCLPGAQARCTLDCSDIQQGAGNRAITMIIIIIIILKNTPPPISSTHKAGKPHTERFRNSTGQGSRGVKIIILNSDFIFPLSVGASRVSQHGNDLDTDQPLFLPDAACATLRPDRPSGSKSCCWCFFFLQNNWVESEGIQAGFWRWNASFQCQN